MFLLNFYRCATFAALDHTLLICRLLSDSSFYYAVWAFFLSFPSPLASVDWLLMRARSGQNVL